MEASWTKHSSLRVQYHRHDTPRSSLILPPTRGVSIAHTAHDPIFTAHSCQHPPTIHLARAQHPSRYGSKKTRVTSAGHIEQGVLLPFSLPFVPHRKGKLGTGPPIFNCSTSTPDAPHSGKGSKGKFSHCLVRSNLGTLLMVPACSFVFG